jgi:hypothetical protein
VLANFGRRPDLLIAGAPVGRELERQGQQPPDREALSEERQNMHCQDTVALFPGPLKVKVPLTQPTVMVTDSPLGYTVSLVGT